jgi:four helix bundle protein
MTLTTQDAVETWKIAHRFVLDVYRLSGRLPSHELHGLTQKIRNSSVTVASNVVEGYARKNNLAYAEHLAQSQTALEESKYCLLVARDLGYISETSYDGIMTIAEELAERLDILQRQLAGETSSAPASGVTPGPARLPGQRPPAFAVKKGVREAWSDLIGWVKGGRERITDRKEHDNVWAEDSPVSSYLEERDDWTSKS